MALSKSDDPGNMTDAFDERFGTSSESRSFCHDREVSGGTWDDANVVQIKIAIMTKNLESETTFGIVTSILQCRRRCKPGVKTREQARGSVVDYKNPNSASVELCVMLPSMKFKGTTHRSVLLQLGLPGRSPA